MVEPKRHSDGTSPDAMGTTAARTPGLTEQLLGHLRRQGLDVPNDQRFSILTGGKSNITYRFDTPRGDFVLRRPPLGQAIATAHDMSREFRVMTALRDTDVPVPRMIHLCNDNEIIGAPFYIMEHVDGATFRSREQLSSIGAARTRHVSESMIDTLTTLHEIAPASVGLADFGRPEGYLNRQVRRWMAQLDRTRTRDLDGVTELHRLLEAHVPDGSAARIVHGDFRLDNLLIDADDQVAATIDWELSTLGEPLADIGTLFVYHRVAELGLDYAGADASRAQGYLTEAEIIERYAAGRKLGDLSLDFFIAVGFFKLVAIREGIHYRHVNGQTVGDGFDAVGDSVKHLIAEGLSAARALARP